MTEQLSISSKPPMVCSSNGTLDSMLVSATSLMIHMAAHATKFKYHNTPTGIITPKTDQRSQVCSTTTLSLTMLVQTPIQPTSQSDANPADQRSTFQTEPSVPSNATQTVKTTCFQEVGTNIHNSSLNIRMPGETILRLPDQVEDQDSHIGGSRTQPISEDAQEPLIAQTGDTKMKNPTQEWSRCSNLSAKSTLWINSLLVSNLSETTNSCNKNHGVTHFFHSQLPQLKTTNTENSSTTAQPTSPETISLKDTDAEPLLCNNNGEHSSTPQRSLALKLK